MKRGRGGGGGGREGTLGYLFIAVSLKIVNLLVIKGILKRKARYLNIKIFSDYQYGFLQKKKKFLVISRHFSQTAGALLLDMLINIF